MIKPHPILAGYMLTKPVRQLFMIGTIWHLVQDLKRTRLELLEIGSWNGGSALTWGEALRLYCPQGGRITCVDIWKDYFDTVANNYTDGYQRMNAMLADGSVYRNFLANMKRMPENVTVETRHGSSHDILPALAPAGYDLIYLDGDHTYEAVRSDIVNAMPLLADGGILCGDDLEIQARDLGMEPDTNPTLDFIPLSVERGGYHPGVTRAIDEIFGPVSAWAGYWAMRKTGTAWEPIDLSGIPIDIPPHLSDDEIAILRDFLLETRGRLGAQSN